ncbi:MAG: Do family serine endopeptidase [Gammaproteobacteria bacterium]|nr:Do family serine endopeptidase [Gammaproteobacteria bacterium]
MVAISLTAAAHEGKLTFAPVLAKATPAVVSIQVEQRGGANPWMNSGSAGSGVIVDASKGHVVTNHHVIDRAGKVTVTLKDRRSFEAELIGSDPATDIALLQIEPDGLHALPLGDSDELAVGDLVVAIGNPFGLGQTATSGIVSALGRSGFSREGYEDFIQTDAAINRGNSGGALVDLNGQLVGINSLIVSPSGVSAGLGFAVPANIVRNVTRQLEEFGDVRRPRLGVYMDPVTPDIVPLLGLDSAQGVIVKSIVEGSSAEDAGIEPGDVIVSIDDEEIVDSRDLWNRIGLAAIGDEVEVVVIRDGKRKTVQATLGAGEWNAAPRAASNPRLAGAEMRDLSREHRLYGRVEGVEITQVERGSPAYELGLEPGDVIVAVNRRGVESLDEFEAAIEGDEPFGMWVQRGLRRFFVVVRGG